MSMYFLRKIIFHFPSKEKNKFSGEKIPSSRIIQERSYSSANFWKGRLFRTFEGNTIFPCIFLRKILFHFPSGE